MQCVLCNWAGLESLSTPPLPPTALTARCAGGHGAAAGQGQRRCLDNAALQLAGTPLRLFKPMDEHVQPLAFRKVRTWLSAGFACMSHNVSLSNLLIMPTRALAVQLEYTVDHMQVCCRALFTCSQTATMYTALSTGERRPLHRPSRSRTWRMTCGWRATAVRTGQPWQQRGPSGPGARARRGRLPGCVRQHRGCAPGVPGAWRAWT